MGTNPKQQRAAGESALSASAERVDGVASLPLETPVEPEIIFEVAA